MQLEFGKTYMTSNGRFVKIDRMVFDGIYWGEYEKDGREKLGTCDRWKVNGEHWNYFFMGGVFNDPNNDLICEDGPEARQLAYQMLQTRKQEAFNQTV